MRAASCNSTPTAPGAGGSHALGARAWKPALRPRHRWSVRARPNSKEEVETGSIGFKFDGSMQVRSLKSRHAQTQSSSGGHTSQPGTPQRDGTPCPIVALGPGRQIRREVDDDGHPAQVHDQRGVGAPWACHPHISSPARWASLSICVSGHCSGTPYTVWPLMWTYLVENKLRQVDAEEALALVKQGAVIVDVRLEEDFKVGL